MKIIVVLLLFSCISVARAQFRAEVDTVFTVPVRSSPSLILEIGGGVATHAGVFFGLRGSSYITNRSIDNIWAPIGSAIATSIVVTIIGEHQRWRGKPTVYTSLHGRRYGHRLGTCKWRRKSVWQRQ